MIFLDFARRWWPVLALAALINALLILINCPLLVTPLVTACVLFDLNRGWVKALRHLPLSTASITTSVWAAGVLVPLTHLPVSALWIKLGWEVSDLFYLLARGDPWFRILHDSWLGLGASSLILAIAGLRARRAESGAVSGLVSGILNILAALMVPAALYALMTAPRRSYHMEGVHWLLVALVPVAMLLSWLAVLRYVKASSLPARKSAAPSEHERVHVTQPQGAGGMSLLLTTLLGRQAILLVGMTLVCALLAIAYHGSLAGLRAAALTDSGGTTLLALIPLCAAILPAMLGEVWSLRMLRMLPISTGTLSSLLLAVPVFLAALAAGLSQAWLLFIQRPAMPAETLLALALGLAGFGAVLVTVSLHLPARWRLTVLALVPVSIYQFLQEDMAGHALMVSAGGLLALVMAFGALCLGLRKSSNFYQFRIQQIAGQ